jgi:hypothetical protein
VSFPGERGLIVDQSQMLLLRRLGAIAFYLPLVGWIGFQAGLRLKNQFQAICACVLILLASRTIPTLIEALLMAAEVPRFVLWFEIGLFLVHWMNPWFVGFGGEVHWLRSFWTSDIFPRDWFPVLFHFLIVGGMLWGIRRNALKSFGRIVRRTDPPRQNHSQRPVPQSTLLLFESANFDNLTSPPGSDSVFAKANPDNANPDVPNQGTNND